MKKKKAKPPVWGLKIASVSQMDGEEKAVPCTIEEWAALPPAQRLPSRQIRARCNTNGESINIGVVEELPKGPKGKKQPPPGPRLKLIGKDGKAEGVGISGKAKSTTGNKSSLPYFDGPETGELCRYSIKGVFELNKNDPWVRKYFFQGDRRLSKKQKEMRAKLFISLEIRGKTIAETYRGYENQGEMKGATRMDESDFINKTLTVQVQEDPLILELTDKMDEDD